MGSTAKRRQTFAKMTRERAVREKRELKREKKAAAAEARRLGLPVPGTEPIEGEVSVDGDADVDTEAIAVEDAPSVDEPATPSSSGATD